MRNYCKNITKVIFPIKTLIFKRLELKISKIKKLSVISINAKNLNHKPNLETNYR